MRTFAQSLIPWYHKCVYRHPVLMQKNILQQLLEVLRLLQFLTLLLRGISHRSMSLVRYINLMTYWFGIHWGRGIRIIWIIMNMFISVDLYIIGDDKIWRAEVDKVTNFCEALKSLSNSVIYSSKDFKALISVQSLNKQNIQIDKHHWQIWRNWKEPP